MCESVHYLDVHVEQRCSGKDSPHFLWSLSEAGLPEGNDLELLWPSRFLERRAQWLSGSFYVKHHIFNLLFRNRSVGLLCEFQEYVSPFIQEASSVLSGIQGSPDIDVLIILIETITDQRRRLWHQFSSSFNVLLGSLSRNIHSHQHPTASDK